MPPKKYVHRSIEHEIRQRACEFPVIALTGSRQTGKSTLLRTIFSDYNYSTLDNPIERKLALDDPALFLDNYQAPLIIDEIQYAPGLLPYIKMRVDKDRGHNGAYIITGSQIFQLTQGLTESLAGRVALYELLGFSLDELKPPVSDLTLQGCYEYIFQGFYPEICVHKADLNTFFNSYIHTYLERDVRHIRAVHDLHVFQDFLELLAARTGSLLHLSEIAKECGISASSVRNWLSILETSGIVYLLRPYFKNVTKRVVKSPKLYFCDTGLLSYILRYPTAATVMQGPLSGAFFENIVLLEMLKYKFNYSKRLEFYFYRDSNMNEADVLIDFGYKKVLVEIKKAKTLQPGHWVPLQKIAHYLEIEETYLVSNYPAILQLTAKTKNVPWWQLSEIFKE